MSSRARLFDLSRKIIKKKKHKRRKDKNKSSSRMQRYAAGLNKNLPKSEQWFQSLFKQTDLYHNFYIHFNYAKGKYIFDVYHIQHKYAIEVDGSYHDTNAAIIRDWYKDQFAIKHGIKLIRIKAYNLDSYNKGIEEIREYIKSLS